MKNKYIFLRHGETIKDPTKPSTEWDLSSDALNILQGHIDRSEFVEITKVISSDEAKAIATGKPVASQLGLPVLEMPEFAEVKREKKFLTDEEFIDQKKRELTNLEQIENGTESARTALNRFISGMEKLEKEFAGENILIVTHGTVLALYLAHLDGDLSPQNIFPRWQSIKFCDIFKI